MTTDLVDRLRLVNPYATNTIVQLGSDAADEIENLRDMCEQLAHALTCQQFACPLDYEGLHNWQAYQENRP